MNVSKFQNIKISDIVEDLNPPNLAVFDIDGNVMKMPKSEIIQDLTVFGNIDGGCANSVYLPNQNITGGSANSVATFRIGGGNALNQ